MRILNEYKTGTVSGTGSAVAVTCGFSPICIIVWNETDGDMLDVGIAGMSAGTNMRISTAVAALGSNGITFTSSGFSLGSSISESGKTLRYLAF